MDRRTFIKVNLQMAAATGIFPVLSYAESRRLAPNEKQTKQYVTGCMWCQNGCSMIAHINNGKLVHLTGNPEDSVTKGKICIKPFGSMELLNSPHRMVQPLKRTSGYGSSAQFSKISWEQALDEIAEKLISLRQNFGGESLGIWASGRSASDGRKLNSAFAKLYGTPNYEKTGPFCNYSGKPAGESVVGTRHTPWTYSDDDFFNAGLYIFVGSNFAATRPVAYSLLRERKKLGKCTICVIDPRKSQTAEEADLWLPIKPGSDLALALCMIHTIISADLADYEFINAHTIGFETLKTEIMDGQYTLAWGAKVTGLEKERIRKLASTYAKTRKAIIIGNAGLSHHTNAVQTHRAFYYLAAITGHYGDKSMGYACLNNGGISTGSLPLPKEKIPEQKMELSKNPVGWLDSIENPNYPYTLQALISTGSPLTQWPDQAKLRRLIPKLKLSVYNGLTRNINARYFDYILPAAIWIEAGGLAPVSDDSRFVWVPKLIEAPGMAKPDRWWWVELAKRMGWGDIFTDTLKDPVKLQNLAGGANGYTVEHFTAKKDNSLRAPIKIVNETVKERETLFLDKRFATNSKKIELWTQELEDKFSSYGLSAVPRYYTDPDIARPGETTIKYDTAKLIPSAFQKNKTYTNRVELIKKDTSEDQYSFYLITGRPSSAIMGHTSHWIKRLDKECPDQFCAIHTEPAKKLGIKDNDMVSIQSAFGEIQAKAMVTSYIREDTIFIPYSFGRYSPYHAWESVNFLTNAEARCPVSGQVAFKGMTVAVKKA